MASRASDSCEVFYECIRMLEPPLDGHSAAALSGMYADFHRRTVAVQGRTVWLTKVTVQDYHRSA